MESWIVLKEVIKGNLCPWVSEWDWVTRECLMFFLGKVRRWRQRGQTGTLLADNPPSQWSCAGVSCLGVGGWHCHNFHLNQAPQRLKALRGRPASQLSFHSQPGVKLTLHSCSQQFGAWLRLSLTVKEIKLIIWCHDSVHSPEDKWLISEVDKNVFVRLPLYDPLYLRAILQLK